MPKHAMSLCRRCWALVEKTEDCRCKKCSGALSRCCLKRILRQKLISASSVLKVVLFALKISSESCMGGILNERKQSGQAFAQDKTFVDDRAWRKHWHGAVRCQRERNFDCRSRWSFGSLSWNRNNGVFFDDVSWRNGDLSADYRFICGIFEKIRRSCTRICDGMELLVQLGDYACS